jgi:O-antigen/teichoic acid export membrane protein
MSGDARTAEALRGAVDVMAVAGLGLAAGGALMAPQIVAAFGGAGFAEAAAPLRVLLAATAMGLAGGVLGNALIAAGRQGSILRLSAAMLTLNVALNVVLVPRFGIMAAAWTALACEAVMLLGSSWLVRRHLHALPSPRLAARAAVAALVMVAALWPLRDAPLWLSIPAGMAVYAVALRAVGVLTPERVRALR